MAKLLFLVVLIVVGALAWRALSRPARPRDTGASPPAPAQRIVKCAVCDVHVPEHEAVFHQGRYFCGADHLQEFSRRHAR